MWVHDYSACKYMDSQHAITWTISCNGMTHGATQVNRCPDWLGSEKSLSKSSQSQVASAKTPIVCRCCAVGMTNIIDISWFRNVSPSKATATFISLYHKECSIVVVVVVVVFWLRSSDVSNGLEVKFSRSEVYHISVSYGVFCWNGNVLKCWREQISWQISTRPFSEEISVLGNHTGLS